MASEKLTALAEIKLPTDNDILYAVDTVAGESKQIKVGTVVSKTVGTVTEKTVENFDTPFAVTALAPKACVPVTNGSAMQLNADGTYTNIVSNKTGMRMAKLDADGTIITQNLNEILGFANMGFKSVLTLPNGNIFVLHDDFTPNNMAFSIWSTDPALAPIVANQAVHLNYSNEYTSVILLTQGTYAGKLLIGFDRPFGALLDANEGVFQIYDIDGTLLNEVTYPIDYIDTWSRHALELVQIGDDEIFVQTGDWWDGGFWTFRMNFSTGTYLTVPVQHYVGTYNSYFNLTPLTRLNKTTNQIDFISTGSWPNDWECVWMKFNVDTCVLESSQIVISDAHPRFYDCFPITFLPNDDVYAIAIMNDPLGVYNVKEVGLIQLDAFGEEYLRNLNMNTIERNFGVWSTAPTLGDEWLYHTPRYGFNIIIADTFKYTPVARTAVKQTRFKGDGVLSQYQSKGQVGTPVVDVDNRYGKGFSHSVFPHITCAIVQSPTVTATKEMHLIQYNNLTNVELSTLLIETNVATLVDVVVLPDLNVFIMWEDQIDASLKCKIVSEDGTVVKAVSVLGVDADRANVIYDPLTNLLHIDVMQYTANTSNLYTMDATTHVISSALVTRPFGGIDNYFANCHFAPLAGTTNMLFVASDDWNTGVMQSMIYDYTTGAIVQALAPIEVEARWLYSNPLFRSVGYRSDGKIVMYSLGWNDGSHFHVFNADGSFFAYYNVPLKVYNLGQSEFVGDNFVMTYFSQGEVIAFASFDLNTFEITTNIVLETLQSEVRGSIFSISSDRIHQMTYRNTGVLAEYERVQHTLLNPELGLRHEQLLDVVGGSLHVLDGEKKYIQSLNSGVTTAVVITNSANITASNGLKTIHSRVGNVVTVTGQFSCTATTGGVAITGLIDMPLPVTITNSDDISGVAIGLSGDVLSIEASTQFSKPRFNGIVAVGGVAQTFCFTYSYYDA